MKKTISVSLMFITNLLLFVACTSTAQNANLEVTEFEKAVNQPNIQLLDVRSAEEFASGHLKNALQADWNKDAEFAERINALDKSKPLYVYCLSGGRSSSAVKWLLDNGFAKVYNLNGGISAWDRAGKYIEGQQAVPIISWQNYLTMIPTDKTVLVDVGAEWCPPCKKMNPIIDSLIAQKYNIIKIDGGTQPELCNKLKIEGFPVFIVYKNGKETKRLQGIVTIGELKKQFIQ
jgi:rhodanese-related sulfurtransferase